MSRLSRAGGARKVPVRYAAVGLSPPELGAALRAHKRGKAEEARAGYQRCLERDPTCVDAWMNLGALYVRVGLADEAADAFEKAAGMLPNDARLFRDVGVGLSSIGRLREAAAALEHSVECNPALLGSWLHLARTRLESTDRPSAIAAARRAVELNSDDPSAWFMLARCLHDPNAPEGALDALQRAAHCTRPYPEAQIFRWLLERHGQAAATSTRRHDRDDETESNSSYDAELRALLSEHPRLGDLAEAVTCVWREMSEARLFSSARDTLRFALERAPAQGNVVELGVFHGVSLRWLVECRPGDVHGFDSFVGLPTAWDPVPEGRFTTAGRPPTNIDARFWVGTFAEQLPRYVASHPESIALLHVDSDLYESAREGLVHLGPLLDVGSVLVFDEFFGHHSWRQDEFRAFHEAVDHYGWHYEALAANPFTGQAVLRLC